jgi:hypothetical protein
VLTPANGAGRRPIEAGPLPEDEAAVETLGRLHAQPLRRPPERASHVGEVIGDLLLRDPDEAREFVGGAWALAEVAKERVTDGDRALCRWTLTSWRGHTARVLQPADSGGPVPEEVDARTHMFRVLTRLGVARTIGRQSRDSVRCPACDVLASRFRRIGLQSGC